MEEMKHHRTPLLSVQNLSLSFRMYGAGTARRNVPVISELTMDVAPGEIVAVAGASGSGKSLLAHAILGLLPPNGLEAGTLMYRNEPLTQKRREALRGKEIALVPQSVSYLDPLMKIDKQVRGANADAGTRQAQKEIFRRFQLEEKIENYYPFQLSGGMARRVLISTAVISGADLIIADEPTPGLDLPMAMEALHIFRELAEEGKAIILITHDIDLAIHVADRVAVFYAGTTVEQADVQDFGKGIEALRHPYTKALWQALPQNGFQPIAGFQPYDRGGHGGCLFAGRCPHRTTECEEQIPMRELRGGYVRCCHAT